jgi:hypothetical protein
MGEWDSFIRVHPCLSVANVERPSLAADAEIAFILKESPSILTGPVFEINETI